MTEAQQFLAPLLEIHQLIDSHRDFSNVLDESVALVQKLLQSDVCSIYLLHPEKHVLVLEASRGLAPESVGKVSLDPGKGLVGKSFQELRPVKSSDVFHEADFEYLPETKEEKYHSLLAVPILYQHQPLGVLAIQHAAHRAYPDYEEQFLQLLSNQLAPLINRSRFQDQLSKSLETASTAVLPLQNELYKGKGASPGIAWGKAFIAVPVYGHGIQVIVGKDIDTQVAAFEGAAQDLVREIKAAKEKAHQHLHENEVAIFEAYEMILEKDTFQVQVIDKIKAGEPCSHAIEAVVDDVAGPLLESEDSYLRERAFDIQDLGKQLIAHLAGGKGIAGMQAPEFPHVLMCENLPIFDLVRLTTSMTQGIVCEEGGTTGHAAILAQSLGLPATMGCRGLLRRLQASDTVLLDGTSGVVIVNPDPSTQKLYEDRKRKIKNFFEDSKGETIAQKIEKPYPIQIAATVGSIAQMKVVRTSGADAIGLYRTEFPFLIRRYLPGEDEQFVLYKQILEEADGLEVTFRILDAGGDKPLSTLLPHSEENPFLGWRAIRLVLARPEIFEVQLRALLRASAFGKMRLLFPMISSLDEIVQIKEHLANAEEDLHKRGDPFSDHVPLGIMIEVPAAVALAEELVQEVDFVSIGSNDLIQYTLAVDRNNPDVSSFYDPFHPAILRSIAHVVDTAHRHHKLASLCGEMAADLMLLPFFLAIHLDSLSVNPAYIPNLKQQLLAEKFGNVDRHRLLRAKNSAEVKRLLGKIKKPSRKEKST